MRYLHNLFSLSSASRSDQIWPVHSCLRCDQAYGRAHKTTNLAGNPYRRSLVAATAILFPALTGAQAQQAGPTNGSGGSSEAQTRLFRAISAASDDVALQLKDHYSDGRQPKLILYDPRILGDLVMLDGFNVQLKSISDELNQVTPAVKAIEGRAPLNPSARFSTLQCIFESWKQLQQSGLDDFPKLRGSRGHWLNTFTLSVPQLSPAALPQLQSVSPVSPGAVTGGSILSSGASTNSGGAGGGGAAQGQGQGGGAGQGSGAGGGGASSAPSVFFANSATVTEALITSAAPLLSLFMNRSSSAIGLSGPSTTESYAVARIARTLPGSYYYPSFVPFGVDSEDNPVVEALDARSKLGDVMVRSEGDFLHFVASASEALQSHEELDAHWKAPKSAIDLENLCLEICTGVGTVGAEDKARLASLNSLAKSAIDGDSDVSASKQPFDVAFNQLAKDLSDPGQQARVKDAIAVDAVAILNLLVKATTNVAVDLPQPYVTEQVALENSIRSATPSTASVTAILQEIQKAEAALRSQPNAGGQAGTGSMAGIASGDPSGEKRAASSGSGASKREYRDLLRFLEDFEHDLSAYLVLDSVVGAYQSAAVIVINLSASVAASPNPQQSAGNVAQAAGTAQNATGSQSSLPSDSLMTVLLRAHKYSELFKKGYEVLRITVEMSSATDRLDTFGINVPSRKVSSAAQIGFAVYKQDGQIDFSGSSLAYIKVDVIGRVLKDEAEILRDEPRGHVIERPSGRRP